MFLTRDVEGQGIGRTRSSGKRQVGSVIWRMILAGMASGNSVTQRMYGLSSSCSPSGVRRLRARLTFVFTRL